MKSTKAKLGKTKNKERKIRRNTTLNTDTELFLSEFFLVQATLGRHLKDGRELFFDLGETFLQPKDELEALYLTIENEAIKEIVTERDYFRYCRYRQYTDMNEGDVEINPELDEIIKIKGDAISNSMNLRLRLEGDVSRKTVFANISSAANAGVVTALRIMGELHCAGVFFEKNEKTGIRYLKKAANWNDCVSMLALMRYLPDSLEYNAARLKMAVSDTPFGPLVDAVKAAYGIEITQRIEEVKLLDKAFHSPVLKREQYEPKYARILYSKTLGIKDKEKAILTESKEFTSAVSNLPLKLSLENRGKAGEISTPLNRVDEQNKITRALSNTDLRNLSSYRPLLLTGGSKFILDMYAKAVAKASDGAHTERIDVNTLNEYDFEPTANNVFVRSADEDEDNYFLIFLCGELSERAIEAVKCILQSGKRSKFHINTPSVTLDLSEIVPVCFCDERNVNIFKQYCDVIRLADLTPEEKPLAIDDMLRHKSSIYEIASIKFEDGAQDVFSDCSIDETEKILDEAIRANRVKNGEVALTKDVLSPYVADSAKNKIGFGFGGIEQ